MMRYDIQMINNIRRKIEGDKIKEIARTEEKDFTRTRKLPVGTLIYYSLNKKGLSAKMEIENFTELCNMPDVSSAAVLKQREKLNPEVFKYLNNGAMEDFYVKNKKEVKTYKGYIVTAVDGSNFEIPNTVKTRREYKSSKSEVTDGVVARASISTQFDLLNKFVLDTEIRPYKTSERWMMEKNLQASKEITGDFKIIRIMDRGYVSIADMYKSNKNDDKYIVRLKHSDFREKTFKVENDSVVEIGNYRDRVNHYRETNPEVYKYFSEGRNNKS